MLLPLSKAFAAISLVTAFSASAMGQDGSEVAASLVLPDAIADKGCHCVPADRDGVSLSWAVKEDNGPYHLICHYGEGYPEDLDCGYTHLGRLHKDFAQGRYTAGQYTPCPPNLAHLFC